MEGQIEGKRGPGRRKGSWLRNVWDWTGMDIHTYIFISKLQLWQERIIKKHIPKRLDDPSKYN